MTDGSWHRYVALGDSITEGFCDPIVGSGEPWLGWADRLAAILDGDARLSGRSIEFANLAVRGRRVKEVVEEQVPAAIELRADLVSIMIGGNDLMAPRADPDALAAKVEEGVKALRGQGIDVLLATCFDPQFAFFLRPFRGRAAVFNANMWSIARTHATHTLDLWGIREMGEPGMWAEDRIHLSTSGHRVLARRAAASLGVPYFELAGIDTPVSAVPQPRGMSTLAWLRAHALPWAGRRMRGSSLGDGVEAKLPKPVRVLPHR